MSFLGQGLTTAIGFSLVMLILSMLITFLVRGLHYLANVRGETLGEMLGTIDLGFRLARGETGEAGDPACSAFVLDITTFPALYPAKTLKTQSKQKRRASGSRARPKKASLPRGRNDSPTVALKNQIASRGLEYIAKDDLLSIVCTLSDASYDPETPVPDVPFPARWCNSLAPSERSLPALVAYIEKYFDTVEGTSSDGFTRSTNQLTRVLSCLVVVLLNLDAFELAQNLYRNKPDPVALHQVAADAVGLGNGSGAIVPNPPPPPTRDSQIVNLTQNIGTVVSLANQPEFELGWQHSWLAQAWCVEQGQCTPGSAEVPETTWGWIWRLLAWIGGLATSCLLLSMGAPFWARQLEQILGWQSAVERNKNQVQATPAARADASGSFGQ